MYITDRKERNDPVIPPELGGNSGPRVSLKLNGHAVVNGHIPSPLAHHRTSSASPKPGTVIVKQPTPGVSKKVPTSQRAPVAFEDTPALVRTQAGMATFMELSHGIDEYFNDGAIPGGNQPLLDRLRALAPASSDYEVGPDDMDVKEENDDSADVAVLGSNKRKM